MKNNYFLLILAIACCSFSIKLTAQEVSIFADGLVSPAGLNFDTEGNLWVTQTGTGNDDGAISIINSEGTVFPFFTGLPSFFVPEDNEIVGAWRVDLSDPAVVYIVQGGGIPPLSNSILKTDRSGFSLGDPAMTLSDLSDTLTIGGFVLDQGFAESNIYSMAWGNNGDLIAADAGANSLIKWDSSADTLSVLTTFPPLMNPTPFGPPFIDQVPTKVINKDGNILMGQLTGFPFLPGLASIYSIAPDGTSTVFAGGLTTITDLAIDPTDGELVALSFGDFGIVDSIPTFLPNSGNVLKIYGNGTIDTLAKELPNCAGLTFDQQGNAYVSNIFLGQVLKINLQPTSNEEIVNQATISQFDVFPNPTSQGLTIQYDLIQNEKVKIVLLDLLGNEYAIIEGANKTAGSHKTIWNGKTPSGIYFLNISTNNGVASKKIIFEE